MWTMIVVNLTIEEVVLFTLILCKCEWWLEYFLKQCIQNNWFKILSSTTMMDMNPD